MFVAYGALSEGSYDCRGGDVCCERSSFATFHGALPYFTNLKNENFSVFWKSGNPDFDQNCLLNPY